MVNIRKLAALDMALHGARFILVEFALGAALSFVLAFFSVRAALVSPVQSAWEAVLGLVLTGIGVNYIPLLIYAALIAKKGSVKEEGQPVITQLKRYSVQQIVILVPFLVVALALAQEGHLIKSA